jgi:hypothetical protein
LSGRGICMMASSANCRKTKSTWIRSIPRVPPNLVKSDYNRGGLIWKPKETGSI